MVNSFVWLTRASISLQFCITKRTVSSLSMLNLYQGLEGSSILTFLSIILIFQNKSSSELYFSERIFQLAVSTVSQNSFFSLFSFEKNSSLDFFKVFQKFCKCVTILSIQSQSIVYCSESYSQQGLIFFFLLSQEIKLLAISAISFISFISWPLCSSWRHQAHIGFKLLGQSFSRHIKIRSKDQCFLSFLHGRPPFDFYQLQIQDDVLKLTLYLSATEKEEVQVL
ncbi:hypothetical protein TTHERM_000473251 (macronuclear) [Tetrahymena thermophila SB210]|uniref:Uncharacterized protein n=1 Tax=Tetrahymena thermophila (strain SB210) TaxID=312017 RepID=W7XDU9_TETTS|nr:hypothetical protein TTHERM_000473251 [Tetrahymena thermophila SB210]EWS72041.1 hypothetical protein TTHERM_000473251 [Tetrahymena thermophila SB210]|eukprot:XP_012655416.1 hypothetical protein TTHERM_000473251 [Tetrahymena thermophila SB210]